MNPSSRMDRLPRPRYLLRTIAQLDTRSLPHTITLPPCRTSSLCRKHLHGTKPSRPSRRRRITRFDQEEMADEDFRLRGYCILHCTRRWYVSKPPNSSLLMMITDKGKNRWWNSSKWNSICPHTWLAHHHCRTVHPASIFRLLYRRRRALRHRYPQSPNISCPKRCTLAQTLDCTVFRKRIDYDSVSYSSGGIHTGL